MALRLVIAIVIYRFFLSLSFALEIREELTVRGQPVSQWIILQDQNKLSILPATAVRQGDIVLISSEVVKLNENILLSAVVQLASGEIISSPFHSWSGSELLKNNNQLKSKTHHDSLRAEVQRLESSLKNLAERKQHEAGFDKVNEIYETVAEVEEQNRALRAALDDLIAK